MCLGSIKVNTSGLGCKRTHFCPCIYLGNSPSQLRVIAPSGDIGLHVCSSHGLCHSIKHGNI